MSLDTRPASPLSPGGPGLAARKLFLQFRIGCDRYLLAADVVVQVLPPQPLKQVPGAPDWVAGILSFKDRPVPVIDLSHLAIGQGARQVTSTRTVLVAHRHRGQAPVRTLGLILEGVTETLHCCPADFMPSGLGGVQARYLGPVLQDGEGGMLQWVGVDELLSDDVCTLLFPATEGRPA
ncbi:chemotaxis protein CheW [Variovorax ginsengisoli]|uniref:Chemotaxis-related protein WspB n=1 Tax=Variovorax ginsengisoli TaxID=363844 RepID=A0ABT9SEI2_9BURK|nr:chemotaxis protein CheW [Variovorax ginsengisoli]MDP9902161.1 chemotaxis-related protein WspB [Variovorax ginsengisoli]